MHPRRAAGSSSRRPVPRSCPIRSPGSSAGSTRSRSCASSPRWRRRWTRTAGRSPIPHRPRRWAGAPASACSTSRRGGIARSSSRDCSASRLEWAPVSDTVVAASSASVLPGFAELRRVAIVPALNEEVAIAGVIDELRAFDPGLDVVVVDDGSVDRTAAVAAARGARVLRLPFNLGIGGAVQTGFRYAFERGYDVAVRVDGDGQHDPSQLPRVLEPVLRGEADIVVGSRFAADGDGYRSSRTRRVGIRLLAWVVSRIVGQRVTDTTSGFQALNREGIALFARDYPHDYPEVEATVMVFRHRLRLREVPVTMRERGGGRSSITTLRSVYYLVKVLLAIFVGLFRLNVIPLEDAR